jgi:predicted ATPase
VNAEQAGREEEIQLLQRRWEQAKRGEGCVVLISGEPGIGKSRIAQTVAERISTEPRASAISAPLITKTVRCI